MRQLRPVLRAERLQTIRARDGSGTTAFGLRRLRLIHAGRPAGAFASGGIVYGYRKNVGAYLYKGQAGVEAVRSLPVSRFSLRYGRTPGGNVGTGERRAHVTGILGTVGTRHPCVADDGRTT
ncbi:hypothetical protein V5799_003525 [Amblyomma americanum]|uniref:Uncharacterized protein n=1 Tax=Amblyomma americanum TaxID=6943 RepID=A0AAQ4D8Q1_AMBAM